MLLTTDQIKIAAKAHGRVYQMMCDEPDCGKLIIPGDLYVVLKWKKRDDGLESIMGRIPFKIRCMTCERERIPPKEEVKIKNAGRNAKAVTLEMAAGITINPILRRIIMRLIKKSSDGVIAKNLFNVLRKYKVVREMSKKEVKLTVRSMKKLKMFRTRAGILVLPKEKKTRNKK